MNGSRCHRDIAMRRTPLAALTALAVLALTAAAAGCGGDPKNPETWIKALDEPSKRAEAVDQLTRLIPEIKDESARAEMEKKAGAAMVKAYETDSAREQLLKALATWKVEDAAPVFVDALASWKEGVTDKNATIAAGAAGALKIKEAVPALIACSKAQSQILRMAAVRALGDIGTPDTVEPLIASMLWADAESQDFFVNRVAAEKLGEIGDPRAAKPLLRALFMRGRGADLFPFAAPSLVRLGPKVSNPLLIEMIEGKNAEVNADAARLAFNQISMNDKAYKIMGLMFDVDDDTRAFLAKSMESDAEDSHRRMYAAEALGRVGGAGTKELLLKYLNDPKTEVPTRMIVQKGLFLLGDPSVVPLLLEQAGPKGITKDAYGNVAHNMRIGAFEAVTLMGGKADVAALEKIIADTKADVPKKPELEGLPELLTTQMAGSDAVKDCDADTACYAGKLKDPDENVVKVAAWHLGVLGAKDKMGDLLAALDIAPGRSRVSVLWAINHLHGAGADPDKVWYAIKRDETEGRKFPSEEVHRDSMITYWNLRRWTAK
jgi:HEAT repeat protein